MPWAHYCVRFTGDWAVDSAWERRNKCRPQSRRKQKKNSLRTFNSPSRLTDDIVELLLIGRWNAFVFELANGRRKTKIVLLGAEWSQWVIAYWWLWLLTMKQVWVLLLERSVEIHESRNRRCTVKGGILQGTKWNEIIEVCCATKAEKLLRNYSAAAVALIKVSSAEKLTMCEGNEIGSFEPKCCRWLPLPLRFGGCCCCWNALGAFINGQFPSRLL